MASGANKNYKGSFPNHSKVMANVKLFVDKQKNRETAGKLYAHDLLIRGVEKQRINM